MTDDAGHRPIAVDVLAVDCADANCEHEGECPSVPTLVCAKCDLSGIDQVVAPWPCPTAIATDVEVTPANGPASTAEPTSVDGREYAIVWSFWPDDRRHVTVHAGPFTTLASAEAHATSRYPLVPKEYDAGWSLVILYPADQVPPTTPWPSRDDAWHEDPMDDVADGYFDESGW